MRTSPTLICCAMPFGYGPAAKLLTLAPLLRRNWRLVFIGHGIAWELVSRCPENFDVVLEGEADDSHVQSQFEDSAALLTVMDRDFARLAAQLERPHYVVDSLLWMRDETPPDLRGATVYWAQRFLNEDQHLERYQPQPTFVGPIVQPGTVASSQSRTGLLVNLGGAEAEGKPEAQYMAYAELVVRAVLASRLPAEFCDRITVVGGANCIAWLQRCFARTRFEFLSLSPTDMAARIQSPGMVLTSPGLTTTLECFRSGTPTYFLPPQNYSQWCVLNHLRRERLADLALDWLDLAPQLNVRERLPEAVRNDVVQEALSRLLEDNVVGELAARLSWIPDASTEHLVREQTSLFQSLGPNGAHSIARQLRQLDSEPSRGFKERLPATSSR